MPTGCKFHPRCQFAMEICKVQIPEVVSLDKDSLVACHLHSNPNRLEGGLYGTVAKARTN
jgi:peptide/nickel transport system ATP-binding protein